MLVPVRASPVPSIVRGSFIVKCLLPSKNLSDTHNRVLISLMTAMCHVGLRACCCGGRLRRRSFSCSALRRLGIGPLASGVCCRISHTRARRATRVAPRRHEPTAIWPRPTLPSRLQLLSSPEDRCLICCLPADAAGDPGGPLYYKEVLTRCPPAIFYPHDSERECDRISGPSATKARSPKSS